MSAEQELATATTPAGRSTAIEKGSPKPRPGTACAVSADVSNCSRIGGAQKSFDAKPAIAREPARSYTTWLRRETLVPASPPDGSNGVPKVFAATFDVNAR